MIAEGHLGIIRCFDVRFIDFHDLVTLDQSGAISGKPSRHANHLDAQRRVFQHHAQHRFSINRHRVDRIRDGIRLELVQFDDQRINRPRRTVIRKDDFLREQIFAIDESENHGKDEGRIGPPILFR